MKYYVARSPSGKWKASTGLIWGEATFRLVVEADSSRGAIAKAKRAHKQNPNQGATRKFID